MTRPNRPDQGPSQRERHILRNSLSSLIRGGISVPINLLLTPYLVHRIGIVNVGWWALFQPLIVNYQLFDLGVGYALTRSLARFRGDPEHAEVDPRDGLRSSFFVLSVVALGGGALAWIWVWPWLGRASVPQGMTPPDLHTVGLCVWGAFVLMMTGWTLTSALLGVERYDVGNLQMVVFSIASAACTVVLVELGFGLIGVALGHTIGAAAYLLFGGAMWWRLSPFEALPGRRESRSAVRALVGDGMPIVGLKIQNLIAFHSDKFVLAVFVGPSAAGVYEIAQRLTQIVLTVCYNVLHPIIPACATLRDDEDVTSIVTPWIERLYRCLLLLLIPGLSAVFLASGPLLYAWIGQAVVDLEWCLRALVLATLPQIVSLGFIYVAMGRGRYRTLWIYVLASYVLIPGAGVVAARSAGLVGVVTASVLVQVVLALVYLARAPGEILLDCRGILRRAGGSLLGWALGVAIPAEVLLIWLHPPGAMSNRWVEAGWLAGTSGLYLAALAALLWWRWVTDDDLRFLRAPKMSQARGEVDPRCRAEPE